MRWAFAGAAWGLACVAMIYGPDCGLGFIKDDYAWIANSQIHGWPDLTRLLLHAPMGFYRPVVSLSFGLNHRFSGLESLPYGLTNLVLAVATAVVIGWLAYRQRLPAGAAVFAASVWIFNFHGIGMSILWTSGRTSLLGTFFAVCAALALTFSRPIACGVFTLLAVLSKEEPLLLPATFAAWVLIERAFDADPLPDDRWRRRIWSVVASGLAIAIYLAMRFATDAFTPATAPGFYQYHIAVIPMNAWQYADRSLTLAAGLLVLGAFLVSRSHFSLTSLERAAILKGVVWLVLGFALTIMLPVRSSLYVLLPSVGSALIAGAIGSAEWRAIDRRGLAVIVLLALPVAFLPVYRARDRELRQEAVLATNALRVLTQRLSTQPVPRLVVYDDAGRHPSMADAFGEAFPIAVKLFVPDRAPTEVVVVPQETAAPAPAGAGTLELIHSGNTLVDRFPH